MTTELPLYAVCTIMLCATAILGSYWLAWLLISEFDILSRMRKVR